MRRRHAGLLVRIVLAGALLTAGWQLVAAGTRTAGFAALLLGGLALLCFVLTLIEVVRFGADEPQAVIVPYQTRLLVAVGAGLTALVAWGRSLTGGGNEARAVTAACFLIWMLAAAGLVSSARTRIGRKRWAGRRGHTFARSDPTLAQRLGWSGAQPCAGAVVTGTYRGRAFQVFDVAEQDGRHTALVMALPDEVPGLAVQAKDKRGARLLDGTAPHWAQHAPQVVAAADEHYPWAFTASGRSIRATYDEFLGPSGRTLDRRLDGLYKVGTELTGVART